tara:strand:+ start:341 stop:658 length:318 start_codon:yes stop_codon:yes gene_type:complete
MSLRWLIRTGASFSKKNKCVAESNAASRAAKDARRQFDYAKREKDTQKAIHYLAEGMNKIADAVERSSNSIEPLAELAVWAAALTESIEEGMDAQTQEIVKQLKN